MTQAYSNPKRANDPHALPDLDIYYLDARDVMDSDGSRGWYWQSCFPGCLPDGDPFGPFETEAEALADAQDGNDDDA